jgi:dolichyl-phosphate beta-glucosyltransferase
MYNKSGLGMELSKSGIHPIGLIGLFIMPKIIIIMPCFNEARRLPLERILSFLEQNPNANICFVNDGSTDATGKMIDDAASKCPGQITTLHLDKNSGKAEAIRQGMLQQVSNKDFKWFAYWDADLSTPLDEINRLLKHSDDTIKFLMCSRVKRLGATVDRHVIRHIMGRVMATIISNVLKLPVYDTQCGAKLIQGEEVEMLFADKFMTEWLFDVELIARLQKKYPQDNPHKHFLEVPVRQWKDIAGSKLKFKHMVISIFDIARIHWKYNVRSKKRD